MKTRKTTFFLLLKQGFKGIFKFRIQFIIILVLSFLATIVLSLSLSTSRKLQKDYDRIVGKVTPFDYVGTTKISGTATALPGDTSINNLRSVALTDFVNDTFVNVANEDGTNDSNYNFVFNDQAYRSQLNKRSFSNESTFLTKVVNDTSEVGFYNLTQKFYETNDLSLYLWNLKETFANQIINDLIAFKNDANNSQVAYLKTTSFGFLIQNNPQFLSFLTPNFKKTDFNKLTNPQQRMVRFIYWTASQVAFWINGQQKTFGSLIFNDVKPNATAAEKTEIFYEFLVGKTGPSKQNQPPLQPNFIIKDDYSNAYNLDVVKNSEWTPGDEDRYLIVNKPGTESLATNQVEALRKKGYRGITSPLSVRIGNKNSETGVAEQVINDVSFTQNYEEFALLDKGNSTPLVKLISLKNNFTSRYDINYQEGDWNPIQSENAKASMFQYHIELNALAADFQVRFRKESIIFDNISSRKFRYIVLNGNEQANFTILKGTPPTANGEIAISEQFARANKIKIGDYITIGQATVMVAGFATDAFTFFPNADPDFPVPQAKTEAIVYGSVETLLNIQNGSGEGSGNQDLTPQLFNFFLTNANNTKSNALPVKKKLFQSLQMDLPTSLKTNFEYLKSLSLPKVNELNQQFLNSNYVDNSPLQSYFSLKSFNDSNYRFSWTLLPLVLRTFNFITFTASLVIAIIAAVALVICIRKTITFNAKQVGILKALGTSSLSISITYLAHSLVIIVFVIPAAWIAGLVVQIPFTFLFSTYFSVPTTTLLVDWISITIAFFGFGIFAMLVSITAAYLIARKPVMEVVSIPTKWSNSRFVDHLKNGIFKNASFHYRFSLTLSSSGKKPIALLVVVVGITSLLISGALALPAIANNAVNSYYKNTKYANAYDNLTPTVNSPLSKPAINYWQGNEKWDADWIDGQLKLDATNNNYGYYKTPNAYMDMTSQSSPIPRYVYFKNRDGDAQKEDIVQNFTYAYAYLLKHPNMFLNLASEIFGDNFFTVLGQSFNIGTVDQFFGLILNSNYATIRQLMGEKYDESLSLDANKQKLAIELSSSLTVALPNVISVIVGATGSTDGNAVEGQTWKERVINAILSQVPPYVKGYVSKSDSRLEQFGIAFNAETYIPKKETFVTKFEAQTNEYAGVHFTGIDPTQQAYTLKKEDNQKLFLTPEALVKVQTIINGDGDQVATFAINGVEIWNREQGKLTLPMIGNKQSQAAYKLKNSGGLTNISTNTRQLKFRSTNGSEPWQILPKYAWVYDDSDFKNSSFLQKPVEALNITNPEMQAKKAEIKKQYQEMTKNSQAVIPDNNPHPTNTSSWLDLYDMDNSKFTYRDLFNNDGDLNDKAYFFNDFSFDAQTKQATGAYVRPFYEYKNIKLFLPKELINENDILKSSSNSSTTKTWYKTVNAQEKLALDNQEYEVPNSVLKAWGYDVEMRKNDASYKPEFLVINPYDIGYAENPGKGLNRLIQGDKNPYWLRYAFDAQTGPGALTYNNDEKVVYGKYNPNNKPFTINFKAVGTINSYDSRLLLIDQDVANMVLGYSNSRSVGYSNDFYDRFEGVDREHNTKTRPWTNQLDTYRFKKPQLDLVVDQNNLDGATYLGNANDANRYAPLKWHTGKLSNIEEPVGLTSSASFNVIDNLGQYSLGLLYPQGLGMTTLIVGQTLLSTQKALINQVYTLAISLGLLLIVAIIVTASLLIMLVGDIYIAQYQRFMILMRAIGYSNLSIQLYTFGMVSVLSLVIWVLSTVVAWVLIFGAIAGIGAAGFAIPYGLSWWPLLVSFVIIGISFAGSLFVSSNKVRKGQVSSLMNETNE